MQLSLPWKIEEEHHLGDPAWSIIEASGMRVAVGLTHQDAEFICRLVNGSEAAARALEGCASLLRSVKDFDGPVYNTPAYHIAMDQLSKALGQ